MAIEFQFSSLSNANNFYRANKLAHNSVDKSGNNVQIDGSDLDIIHLLSEFNLLESADSVEFYLWNDDQPDVIIDAVHSIPKRPVLTPSGENQEHQNIRVWLEAFRDGGASDRKKVLQAIRKHPNEYPETVDSLVPTLIDALKDPNMTNTALRAINNITDQRPQAVGPYIDRIRTISRSKNALVSNNASDIAENIDQKVKKSASESKDPSVRSNTRDRRQNNPDEPSENGTNQEISYIHNAKEIQRGRIRHEDALDILEEYLQRCGLEGGETDRSDLITTDGENVLLIEAKDISNNEQNQIRKAVGQLLEYRYRDILDDRDFANMDLTLWLLLTQEPSGSFKSILDSFQDKGIYSLWVNKGEIDGLEQSLATLEEIRYNG